MSSLTCYQVREDAFEIVPGRATRDWMDQTEQRFAYRCLPLSIANGMGWELLLPDALTATWNGGDRLEDISIETGSGGGPLAESHFGHGVLTFRIGYLFRTDPGIGIWARGIPNRPKDGIAPLEGIIETDWLDFTFTMNWKFTRPGTVNFEKDEPCCFITLVDYHALADVVPRIVPIEDAPDLDQRFRRWSDSRRDFNARLAEGEPEAVAQGWQKWYMRGVNAGGETQAPGHLSKIRLAEPVRGEKSASAKSAE